MTLIDATSVINPYAADLVRHRVRIRPPARPSSLGRYVGVPPSRVTVTNGARDALRTLLTGPVLLSLPTCPAYYDLVQRPGRRQPPLRRERLPARPRRARATGHAASGRRRS